MAKRIALLLIVAAGWAAPSVAQAQSGPIVRTSGGLVQGFVSRGVVQFRGIPYAAPPVGALRWHAPEPAAPWSGVLEATHYGPRCPQLPSGNGPGSTNENCLYLNVFAPNGLHADAGLPVLFWIHGGGFVNGSGDQHEGSLLARTDHMIVVSINYRLGIFGFLALPSLSSESSDHSSGDYGLEDQQAALRWVSANARAFGGDPARITVDGESAGGWSVCDMLASPLVHGRFDAAIIQSGGCPSLRLSTAEASGAQFAAAAGCSDPSTAATCLRAKPASALLNTLPPSSILPVGGSGRVLPIAPAEAIASGRFNRVPVINGSNRNEGRTFTQGLKLDQGAYLAYLQTLFGADAAKVAAMYPLSHYPQPYAAAYAAGAAMTDSGVLTGIGGCGTVALTQALSRFTPTYQYEFNDEHAPALNHNYPGYHWGSGHAMELAYLWPSFNNGIPLYAQLTPAQRKLSNEMVRYWGAMAAGRAPVVAGQPPWPQFGPSQEILSLRPGDATRPISLAAYRQEHNCAFWNALGYPQTL